LKNPGKVFNSLEIVQKLWGYTFTIKTNIIAVHINSLRKKIDSDFSPKLLHTLIGFGYTIKESK